MITVFNQRVVLTGWLPYLLSLLNIEFMIGVDAAWFVGFKGLRRKGLWAALLMVAIALLSLWLMTQYKMPYLQLMFAMGLAILIVGFSVREQMGERDGHLCYCSFSGCITSFGKLTYLGSVMKKIPRRHASFKFLNFL